MWLLPSRQRPANLERFFDAYFKTGATTPGIVWLDSDDHDLYLDIYIPENWRMIIADRLDGTGPIANAFFEKYPDEPWYGFLADDVVPTSFGWDTALIEAAGSNGLAYGDDGLTGEKNASHPVIGGDLVRSLGWLGLPGCKRIYIDNALMEVARRKGELHYLPEVKMEHRHFSNGKAEYDATYEKLHNAEDKAVYDAWLESLKKPVTFVCVNAHNYLGRGAEYVNNLYDMVIRNLPAGYPGRFVCYTDDSSGLHPAVVSRTLPEGVQGWWNKLYLFKDGEFEYGERVVYLDLDTCITGGLDNIVTYSGPFAILRDFYRPDKYGPGMMLWEGGFGRELWETYEAAGFPTDLELGDWDWSNNRFAKTGYKPHILQKLFPKQICSYKDHARDGIPKGARVVCFHGLPRPHEAGGWVPYVWKEGGGTTSEMEQVCNTEEGEIIRNIRASMAVQYDRLRPKVAYIIGGGPSLKYDLGKLRGGDIFATNATYEWLQQKGIDPHFHVMLDARKENAEFVPEYAKCYYASQCHPDVFKAAVDRSCDVTLWHSLSDGIVDIIGENTGEALVGGGSTVGLKAMALAYILGYKEIHLFGFDSSYEDEAHHAYDQPLNDGQKVLEFQVGGEKFRCAPWMATQAEEFKEIVPHLLREGCSVTVNGYGLIPYLATQMRV